MELLREGFGRLAIITGGYYRGFKKFSLFTKIVVIGGVLFAELGIIGNSGVTGNSFWGRLAEILTFHFIMLMFLIKVYNIIEMKKDNKLELDKAELSEDEKASLESERENVDLIEVTGLRVPMTLRPEESKYIKKMESIEIESRKGEKRGFAAHPPFEKNDIKEQKE